MATLQPIRYPLDPTGTSPDNSVAGEVHALPARTIRVVAPSYGAFYTESVKVKDLATGLYLTKGTDFYPAELYELPTAHYGKEICAIIVITNQTVSPNISLDYQALGGEYSIAADAVVNQIYALQNDNRPVAWGDIIAKPSEYPPSHHLHDVGDIYGFEYVVHAIDRLRAAILTGDDYSHDQIYQYIDSKYAGFQAQLNTMNATFMGHINDHSNPHQVTAAQVGAYTTGQVDALVGSLHTQLDNHVNDHNNPHFVTAAQVGAYSTTQVDNLVNGVQTNLTNHINASNPHPQYVRHDVPQGLAGANQAQARANIGAEVTGTAQSLMNNHTGAYNPHPQYLMAGSAFTGVISTVYDVYDSSNNYHYSTNTPPVVNDGGSYHGFDMMGLYVENAGGGNIRLHVACIPYSPSIA